jgi:two-component system OmpR family response regulator
VRILLVEDEPRIAVAVAEALRAAGYAVDRAADGEEALFLGETEPYDAAVLDLGLPRLDWLSVLRRWRSSGLVFPVLILTARDSWREKVEGIDAGADDYLAKPFRMAELIARLRAIIRRTAGQSSPVMSSGSVTIDTRSRQVELDGLPVDLTALEYRCLSILMLNRNRPVSQLELTEQLYAQDHERESNAIEVLINRLRRKLGHGAIVTRRGFGYQIAADET